MYLETFKIRITNLQKKTSTMRSIMELLLNQAPAEAAKLTTKLRTDGLISIANKNLLWENDTTATLEWSRYLSDEGYNLLIASYSIDQIRDWIQSEQVELILYDIIEQ